MLQITFNAFSFLQKKLQDKNIECRNVQMEIEEGTSVTDLVYQVQLEPEELEVVLVNGRVASLKTIIQDNDRVAFVPPGTPGPYRVLLGFKNKKNQ